jgi:hypothetical protein
MDPNSTDPVFCNCTAEASDPAGLANANCRVQLGQILGRLNAQMNNDFRTSPERLANADLYSIVILCLFAVIIIVIMIRAIKPTESLDDQVSQWALCKISKHFTVKNFCLILTKFSTPFYCENPQVLCKIA